MGNKSAWSDVGYGSEANAQVALHGYAERVVFSVRQNAARLLRGETVFESAVPGSPLSEMDVRDIAQGRGHGELL